MPRPLWKGAISFGMVSIPVKLYTATEEKDVRFNMLHREGHVAHETEAVLRRRGCRDRPRRGRREGLRGHARQLRGGRRRRLPERAE